MNKQTQENNSFPCLPGRCVRYGVDYYGYPVDHKDNIYHWADCAKLCNAHRSCSYWTWSLKYNKCFLKSSDKGGRRDTETISGAYDCLSEC